MNREPRIMKKKVTSVIIPNERIIRRIFFMRGKKVMIDSDLAEMYGVTTGQLNQAVKRNKDRFPEDFMFQFTAQELENWKSQIVISNRERMGLRKLPYVFTEQGVAMLSSVLKSKRAIQINIHIMRVFTELREMLLTHKDLRDKIEKMERKYDKQFRVVFDALRQMMIEKIEPVKKIGFKTQR